jgi:hypothetical protein
MQGADVVYMSAGFLLLAATQGEAMAQDGAHQHLSVL